MQYSHHDYEVSRRIAGIKYPPISALSGALMKMFDSVHIAALDYAHVKQAFGSSEVE
jgi:hypothetical protein